MHFQTFIGEYIVETPTLADCLVTNNGLPSVNYSYSVNLKLMKETNLYAFTKQKSLNCPSVGDLL